jgi:hypothetical protein
MSATSDVPQTFFAWLTMGLVVWIGAAGCGGTDEAAPGEDEPECETQVELTTPEVNGGTRLDEPCYRAAQTLSVIDGTLTVESGVKITFASGAGLDIRGDGRLRTEGTEDEPVFLVGGEDERGAWRGVRLVRTKSTVNQLTHTMIRRGGGSSWGSDGESAACVYVEGNPVQASFTNLQLRGCEQAGLLVDGPQADIELQDSAVRGSAVPMRIVANAVRHLSGGNTYEDNDDNRIHVIRSGQVVNEATWPDPGVAYAVGTTLTPETELTLEEGARLEFESGRGLSVNSNGALVAAGSEDQPVVFAGAENGRGAWRGIRFTNSSSSENLLDHARVVGAGGEAWGDRGISQAGVFVEGDATALEVQSTRIASNQVAGVAVDAGGADVTLEGNAFVENAVPLRIRPNLVGRIAAENEFRDNEESYVRVDGGTVRRDATWFDLEVPYRVAGRVGIEARLTIAPGSSLAFEQGVGLDVRSNGQLTVDAADGEAVRMVGVEQQQGYWQGVRFVDTASENNLLVNVDVLHAGSDPWREGEPHSQAAIYLQGASRLDVAEASIRASGFHGLSVTGDSEVVGCSGVEFANNAEPAVWRGDEAVVPAGCGGESPTGG